VDSININFLAAVRLVSATLPSLLKSKGGGGHHQCFGCWRPGRMPGFLSHYGSAKAAPQFLYPEPGTGTLVPRISV